jgi:hypothetical protein
VSAFGAVCWISLGTLLIGGNVYGAARTAAILGGFTAAIVGVVVSCRVSLRFDDDEVVIRNFFRTRRFRWDDLEAVSTRWVLTPANKGMFVPRMVRFIPRGGGWGTAAEATRVMGSRTQSVLEALREQAERHGVRYEIAPFQARGLK